MIHPKSFGNITIITGTRLISVFAALAEALEKKLHKIKTIPETGHLGLILHFD